LEHQTPESPRFTVTLQQGWNRLLLKITTSPKEDFTEHRLLLRIMDPPDVPYDSENIVWMTELPARSTSTPILAGDKLFVMAEPDELLCLDKSSGKILWTRQINYYETVTAEERAAQPAYGEQVQPLVERLRATADRRERQRLRSEIQQALVKIDDKRFTIKTSGHFSSHFGIVGFTMPTPLCDGERVYVWNGLGVAACFDLAGNRQWITRVETDELNYGSSPALADGVLAVFLNGLFGLDAATGKLLWSQPRIKNNVAALLAMKVGEMPVIVTQRGDIIHPRTGEPLFRPRGSNTPGDIGWSPPAIHGSRIYAPAHGVTNLAIWDYQGVDPAGKWEPQLVRTVETPPEVSRKANGGWIDRWTAGSPLVVDNFVYQTDIYHWLYVSDVTTGKMVYRQLLPLEGFTHYNAVAVAASPTWAGGRVLLCDNQGTTVVVEPGPTFRVAARNMIHTQLERQLPLPAQETLCYAPPIADGQRLYFRGERYLYCVGK
jgi:outer membrane protein assembly factor BamB